jgi:hypothetical protein
MFLAILPANALFAGGYEKDVIMSPAGLFYGVAGYFVVRQLLSGAGAFSVGTSVRTAAPAIVLLVAVGWTVRFVGIHDSLRERALSVRDEWAYYDDWEREQPRVVRLSDAERAIKQRLFEDAISRAPRSPQVSLGAIDQLFDHTQ